MRSIALAIAFTGVCAFVTSASAQVVCGDCNQDMNVSILDALVGAQTAAGVGVLSGPALEACDVDASCGLNILDALLIAQDSAGVPVSLGCHASCAFQVTPTCLPGATQGQAYSVMLSAGGATPPCNWSSGCTLPPGLSLNSTTGELSGTPTQSGNYFVTIVANCGGSQCARGTYLLRVGGGATLTLPPGFSSRIHSDLLSQGVAQAIDMRTCINTGAFGQWAGQIFTVGADLSLTNQFILRIDEFGEAHMFADGSQFANPIRGGVIDALVGGIEFHPDGNWMFGAGINYNSTGVYYIDPMGNAGFLVDSGIDIYSMDTMWLEGRDELLVLCMDLSNAESFRVPITLGGTRPIAGALQPWIVPPATGDHQGITRDSGGTYWATHIDFSTMTGLGQASAGTIDPVDGTYTPITTQDLGFAGCSGIDGDIQISPSGRIFISAGQSDPTYPNSILELDPMTGNITQFAGGFTGVDVYCGTVENGVPSGIVFAPASCGSGQSLYVADGDKIWEIVGSF